MVCAVAKRPDYLPPVAWMGFVANPDGGFLVKVCSWCPDAKEATKQAAPLPVTHGICTECHAEYMKKLLGGS